MARRRTPPGGGEGTALDAGRLSRVPQGEVTWEADFRALPKPLTQTETRYLGVVTAGGPPLAESEVGGRPSAGDLADLLARAMLRPGGGKPQRPRHLRLRGHRQWRELFPRLEELGVGVAVQQELPAAAEAYNAHLRKLREARRAGMTKPSGGQAAVETLFPTVAKWVGGYGHIEIGDQEGFGFVVRALDYGGMVFEDDGPETLAEAMAALERGLAAYFKREGIE